MAEREQSRLLETAFAAEEHRSLAVGARILVAVLPVIAVWVTIENGFPDAIFFYPFLLGFALLGVSPLLLTRLGWEGWVRYVPSAFGIALFTVVVVAPNPLDDYNLPMAIRLRHGNEQYLFLFIAISLFSYAPRLVWWTGLCAALCWSVATLWVGFTQGWIADVPEAVWAGLSVVERERILGDPHHVDIGQWIRQVISLLVVSSVLAGFVRRARLLVLRQADAERQRANLSRYFSPNVVEELAQSDEPLGTTRTQDVAVLFVDIVGFTNLCARRPPAEVIGLLREFHRRMAQAVFANDGTLDKYLGDGIMATFGTPRPGQKDATNALACGRAMLASIESWNRDRTMRGEEPIEVGVGIHYGPVVLGDIGSDAQLEFAVLGDTVNVASRIEQLTRQKVSHLLVSQSEVDAIAGENSSTSGLVSIGAASIRGREDPIVLWRAD